MSLDIDEAAALYRRWGPELIPARLSDGEFSELRTTNKYTVVGGGIIGALAVGTASVAGTGAVNPVIAHPTMQVRWPNVDPQCALNGWKVSSAVGWCGAAGVNQQDYPTFASYVRACRVVYIDCGLSPGMLPWVELLEEVVASANALIACIPNYGAIAAITDQRELAREVRALLDRRGHKIGRVSFYSRTANVGGVSMESRPVSFYVTDAVRFIEAARLAEATIAADRRRLAMPVAGTKSKHVP